REPFDRLIAANRMDQRISEYETWADIKHYCVHSADPCGRLVLGVLRRLDDAEAVELSDDVCTGLQLVNFLQDVPRDVALGRVYLPAVRCHLARAAERAAARTARVRGGTGTQAVGLGRAARPPARREDRACSH